MPYYRLFYLSPASGHFDRVEGFDATDDVQAISRVKQSERDSPVELWQASRKVLRLQGTSDGAASAGAKEPGGENGSLGTA